MLSKIEPVDPAEGKDGSRLAIVFNGSPLFTGGAGSGESEIRKWVIEQVEADPELAALREALGPQVRLFIDFHWMFTAGEAVAFELLAS